MASIQYIENRILGKEKEIEKLEKKMGRIEKAAASGWEVNPYYYNEYDIKRTGKELDIARAVLSKLREDLARETEKAKSRDVLAILKFLEAWKIRVTKFYENGLSAYYAEHEAVRNLYSKYSQLPYGGSEREAAKAAYGEARASFDKKCRGYFEKWENERNGRVYKGETKVRDGEYEHLRPYREERNIDEALKKLEKDLVQEANRKYDYIIERTNAIVGEITDASGLRVGEKGDLNGLIIGTAGVASVQTFGAGGYNIQCFHFRTTIKPVR